ncbi:MAG: hypothetical protein ACRDTD_16080 [Pseudonocardiaceae bacterium]
MVMQTRDYAKLGQRTWRCAVFRDDGAEVYARYGPQAEYPNKGLAVAWVNRALRRVENPAQAGAAGGEQHWWGRIERGHYVDRSFRDGGEVVQDADWEQDEFTEPGFAFRHDDGTVGWSGA